MAAVATRAQGPPSNPTSRINSPVDHTKRSLLEVSKQSPKKTTKNLPNRAVTSQPKVADDISTTPSTNNNDTTSVTSTSNMNAPSTTEPSANTSTSTAAAESTTSTSKASSNSNNNNDNNNSTAASNEPTSLPAPPAPAIVEEPPSAPNDYFSGVHHNKYGDEPNPFEQSFSVNDGITPGKALLPPASSITSPSPNLGSSSAFNWGLNSLRSGPLSPAMLTGPSVYDTSLRTGLTPNESGIRSGLTPGGSGSMFPVASPSAAALFGFGSGTTPGTMEFHKTALAAQAQNNRHKFENLQQPVPKVEDDDSNSKNMLQAPLQAVKLNNGLSKPNHVRQASDPFGGGDADAAASGLYMLAQQGQQHQNDTFMGGTTTSFTPANMIPGQPVGNGSATDASSKRGSIVSRDRQQSASTGTTGRGMSEISDGTDNSMNDAPATTTKAKSNKKTPAKGAGVRRKTEDTKGPPAKKQKSKSNIHIEEKDEDDDDIMDEDDDDDKDINGRKMTEDEKRKNFLERNRVAALKCRQRKKQWLANLQAKVEYYGAENDALHSQVANLRDEVIQLKTLLLAHKDCPVNRSAAVQGLAGVDGISALGQASEYQMNHAYAQAAMAPPGRRFS